MIRTTTTKALKKKLKGERKKNHFELITAITVTEKENYQQKLKGEKRKIF